MHIILQRKIIGLTLLEMLVSLVINVVILSGLLGVVSSTLGHYNKMTNQNLLSQQLQTAMQLMIADIRRAGYWSNAKSDVGTGQNNNPFMAAGVDLAVSNNCILFAYDRNNSGTLPSISAASDDERYGFRLITQILQTRPPGAVFSCTAAANAWENLTDPNIIQITGLTFTLTQQTVAPGLTSKYMAIRSVDISLTGRLVSDNSITKTITAHVRIRNDKFTP